MNSPLRLIAKPGTFYLRYMMPRENSILVLPRLYYAVNYPAVN